MIWNKTDNKHKEKMRTTMDLSNGIPESGITVKREGTLTRLYFDYSTESVKDEENGGGQDFIVCEQVDMRGALNYANIVSAIVGSRYSMDDTVAVLANKALADDTGSDITDGKRAEYKERYAAFQEWRVHAKEIAKKILAKE